MDKRAIERRVTQLEEVLKQQTAAHQQLLAMLKRKRQLLAQANRQQLAELTVSENQIVQSISELEKQRLNLTGELTLIIEPTAKVPKRLGELAEMLPEPGRGRLLVLRQQLIEQMEKVKDETVIARRATESLVKHMQGLIRTVGSVITGVGVYSRQGCLPKEATAVRTIHVTA